MTAIFKREFKSYFTGPIGYVALLYLFFLVSLPFIEMFSMGYPYIDYIFASASTFSAFIIPIITMRLFSEERKNKTDQALLTAPVSIVGIVLGKFFAAISLFAAGFLPTLVYQVIVSNRMFAASKSSVNWKIFLVCYLAIVLFGAALTSIGCFISSLTESQAVAAILGIAATLVVMIIDFLASLITFKWFAPVTKAISDYSFLSKLSHLLDGMLNVSSIVYFLSVTVFFLFLTVLSVNKRRWK